MSENKGKNPGECPSITHTRAGGSENKLSIRQEQIAWLRDFDEAEKNRQTKAIIRSLVKRIDHVLADLHHVRTKLQSHGQAPVANIRNAAWDLDRLSVSLGGTEFDSEH